MSARRSLTDAQRMQMMSRLRNLVLRMIIAAARKDEAAPTHTEMLAEARRRGLDASNNAVRLTMVDLLKEGRIALLGSTCHAGYSIPGTDLRTQSSCQPVGYRSAGIERRSLRCPTLEERAAAFGGERPYAVDDVVPPRGRDFTGNAFLEAHGWTSPLAEM